MARVRESKSAQTIPGPVAEAAEASKPKLAKNTQVIASKTVDTRELQGPAESTVKFDAEGNKHVEGGEIEIENNLDNLSEKAAALKFMEEKVTIIISQDSDKNAEKYVFCSVNGRGPGPGGIKRIPRGVEVDIARKFVEVLVRAQHERVGNKEVINSQGERSYEYPKTASQKYPFQVVRDDNPRGRQWLSDLMRQR